MALCVGKHSECPARMTASPTYRSPGFCAQVGEQYRAGELFLRDEPPHVLVVGARRRGNRQEAADRRIRRIAATLAANAAVQVVITRRAVRVIVAESGSTVSSVMRITSFRIFRQRSGEFSYFARGFAPTRTSA